MKRLHNWGELERAPPSVESDVEVSVLSLLLLLLLLLCLLLMLLYRLLLLLFITIVQYTIAMYSLYISLEV